MVIEQSIRTVIDNGSLLLTVMKIWEKDFNYYSSISGKPGHSSYHKSGKTHSKYGKWGTKDSYGNMIFKTPATNILKYEIIHGMSLRNDNHFSSDYSFFKKYKRNEGENIVTINQKTYKESDIFLILNGFSPKTVDCRSTIKQDIDGELLEVIHYFETESPHDHKLFTVVFLYDKNSEPEKIKNELNKIGLPTTLQIPPEKCYLEYKNGKTSLSITGFEFGSEPPRLNLEPAKLPIPVYEHMEYFKFHLCATRYKNEYIDIADLSFKALSPLPDRAQRIIILRKIDKVNAESIHLDSMNTIFYNCGFKILSFQAGHYGGHTIQQFELNNINYQLELLSFSVENDKGNVATYNNEEKHWIELKLTKLQ